MKAAICKTLEGPQSLEIADIVEPVAAADEVLVDVKAVGLNFADTLITRGKYQFKPELPFSPGAEIAGVVAQPGVGSGRAWARGQRVMAYVNWGGAREKTIVAAEMLVAIPDTVGDEVAAGLSVTYGTAIHGLKDRAALRRGETVVVTGAAGGAGQAAIEVAKLIGARVIAVASSAEKCAIARECGADETIVYPGCDLKAAVREITEGGGAEVVYDCIGGDAAEPLVRALAWGGRFIVVGFAAGEIPRIPLNLTLLRGCDIRGVFWGEAVRRNPAQHVANMSMVLDWVAAGRLQPRLHGVYPLAQIRDALGVLDRREATGKVVLTI